MVHIELPLNILLCRQLLRDFESGSSTKDLLEEIRFYLNQSKPLYFDQQFKETADLVLDGMLNPKENLTLIMDYLNEKY